MFLKMLNRFLRKTNSRIKFFFLEFYRLQFLNTSVNFGLVIFAWQSTALGLKRSERSEYCFIYQGYENSERGILNH